MSQIAIAPPLSRMPVARALRQRRTMQLARNVIQRPVLSIVLLDTPRRAFAMSLVKRESPSSPFVGVLTYANGTYVQSTAAIPLPRPNDLEHVYEQLSRLLPTFECQIAFDGHGNLVELQLLSDAMKTDRSLLEVEDVTNGDFDEAFIRLLVEHSAGLVVHAAPSGGRLGLDPWEWLCAIDASCPELHIPSGVAVGNFHQVNLVDFSITRGAPTSMSSMHPAGFVLCGPPSKTRPLVCAWLTRGDDGDG